MTNPLPQGISRLIQGRVLIAVIAVGVLTVGVILLAVQAATRSSHPPDRPAGSTAPTAGIAQVPGLPPGATGCPTLFTDPAAAFAAGARGTPMTSCPFVEQTRRSFTKSPGPDAGPRQLRVASPSTGKWYDLVCVPSGTFVTCSGGVGAIIYLYNP